MRLLVTLLVVLAVGFFAVMGFYYWREGSLQAAGAKVDEGLARIDRTTQPLQDSVKDLGEGAKQSIDNATDGDDRT